MTEEETRLLDTVTEAFETTILLLNIGNVMDLSFVEKYKEKLGALSLQAVLCLIKVEKEGIIFL